MRANPAILPVGQCPRCLDIEEIEQCPECSLAACWGCIQVRACDCPVLSDAVPTPIHDNAAGCAPVEGLSDRVPSSRLIHDQTPDSARTGVHARARHGLKTSGHLSGAAR